MPSDIAYIDDTGTATLVLTDYLKDDTLYSRNTLLLWSEADRNDVGVYSVLEPAAAPEGQVVLTQELGVVNGVPAWVATYGPPPVPPDVDSWRAKLVLSRGGLLDLAQSAIDGYGSAEAKIYWNSVPRWSRTHDLIAGISFLIDLTSEQVDDLFRQSEFAE